MIVTLSGKDFCSEHEQYWLWPNRWPLYIDHRFPTML